MQCQCNTKPTKIDIIVHMDWQAALNKMQKYESNNSKNIPSVIIEESGQNPQYENCRWEP